MSNAVRVGMSTPWGRADYARMLCEGIGTVGTSSHGGIRVYAEQNQRIPEYMRNADGWYEEDCDWCIPFLVFQHEIVQHTIDHPEPVADAYTLKAYASGQVLNTLRNWKPDAHERRFGVELKPGESYMKDQRAKDAVA